MAITLGTLFVELKANTAQFLDGMTKASTNARAFGRDLETGFSKMGELFAPLGEVGEKLAGVFQTVGNASLGALSEISKSGPLVGGFAALTGGAAALGGTMFALAEKSSEVGAKIYEAGEKTGISAQQLSGLMAIAKETGGNFDSLVASLAKAGANLQKAIIDPGGQAGRVLSQLMGGAKQLQALDLKPMGDRIQAVIQKIFEMNNVGERNLALNVLLGKGWQENISILKLLAEQGYGPAIEQAKVLGYNFTDLTARSAKDFQSTVSILTGELEGLGLTIGQRAVPAIVGYLDRVHELLPYIEAWYQGMKGLVAISEALAAAMLTPWNLSSARGFLAEANNDWKQEQALIDGADEAQNRYLINRDRLTAAARAAGVGMDELSKVTKAHADALAELISKEKEEIAVAMSRTGESGKLRAEYEHTLETIQRLIDAGGNYAEGLKAWSLAADVFAAKVMAIKPVIPELGFKSFSDPEWIEGIDKLYEDRQKHLRKLYGTGELDMDHVNPPAIPGGLTSTPPATNITLSQYAALGRAMDTTRAAEHALKLETDLSPASFAKLVAAFPALGGELANVAQKEIAATAAGQKFIEQLSKMDKVGTMGDQFQELYNTLTLQSEQFGSNLVKILGGAIDQVESKIAQLVVKGRVNFRELGQSVEESLVKAGLQKGVGSLLSITHTGSLFGGGKRDGSSPQNSLFTTITNDAGKIFGSAPKGASLFGAAATPSGDQGDGGEDEGDGGGGILGEIGHLFSGLGGGLGQAFGLVGKGIGAFAGFLSHIFGGFLASGGEVTSTKGYVVGENGPEFFLPKTAGHVVPALGPEAAKRTNVTTVNFHVHGVTDVDNFKRSKSQIMSELAFHMNRTLARNRS